ncbi:MAG: FG-GAP repeat protein, partial [Spirochaetales bacterium]|nr:FG-GAP repeat protein [Spirochaetales bacterium]
MDRTNAPGNIDRRYADEDRNAGRQGTAIIAADRNAIQEELVHLIEGAGLDPSTGDLDQLRRGVTRMVLAARADGARNIVGAGVAEGFEVGITGAILTIAPGEGWDAAGRRVALKVAATIDLAGTVGRPGAGNYKWVSVVARAAGAVPNDIIDIGTGNEPHRFAFGDECIVIAMQGAEALVAENAQRPDVGDDLLLADVLVNATTAWDALSIETGRRSVVVRNDAVEARIRSQATEIAKDLARKSNAAVLPGLIHTTERKFTAPDGQEYDIFGYGIDIFEDYMIVGAHREDSKGTDAGAAYVFHRTGVNTWDVGTKLLAADGATNDLFGHAVAIWEDYAILGGYGEDTYGNKSGAAYVFRRTGENTWDGGTKLLAPDGAAGDRFGISVAIWRDYAVVGSYSDDDGGEQSGSVYVFRRTGENAWDDVTKLVAPDAAAGDFFGFPVAIRDNCVITGANQKAGNGANSGAAYVFRRTGENTWDAGTKLLAPDGASGDFFGHGVALHNDYAIVGAYGKGDHGTESG